MDQLPGPAPPSTLFRYTTLFRSVSFTDTPWATPAPLLVTVMVNPMGSPADTVWLSATLERKRAGPSTRNDSEAYADPSLMKVTLAVLSTGELAAVAEVVAEVMCR